MDRKDREHKIERNKAVEQHIVIQEYKDNIKDNKRYKGYKY